MIRLHIDFEYNTTNEMYLNLVCAAVKVYEGGELIDTQEFWLHKDPAAKERLKDFLKEYKARGAYIIAFAASAEAASFISLGLDPTKFKWICLQIMYRMLTNHIDKFRYGSQLIDGKEVTTFKPIGKFKKERSFSNQRPQTSLVSTTYKMLGVHRSSEHKDAMRDLIISAPDEFSALERKDIQEYCMEDVEYMEALFNSMFPKISGLQRRFNPKPTAWDTVNTLHNLSQFAAYNAFMERRGYPVDPLKIKRFMGNTSKIIKDLVDDILEQDLPIVPFIWVKRSGRYKMEQKVIRDWLKTEYEKHEWEQTASNQYSLKLDAFSAKFSYRHDYPRDNLGAQMVRYLKVLQSLNGFRPKGKDAKDQTTFLNNLGSDGRVRPYLNAFGSQSGRSQPKATGFIPLKAAWMRSLIEPKEGKAIVGIDWGSQEFLISAIVSGDENMFEAYRSGDVYLHFAKLAGAVPMEGTKKKYAKERNLFKSTVLGISYNMGAISLAKKLTADTGALVTEKGADDYIEKFHKAFPQFAQWNDDNIRSYNKKLPIIMPDGWMMGCDNPNWRSVNNVPIQGAGASIMRLAVKYAHDRGVNLIYTLHDALYAEFKQNDIGKVDVLYDAMKDAFVDVWTSYQQKEFAKIIRQDIDVWGPGMVELYPNSTTPNGHQMKVQNIYVDERSEADYDRFKKYF